MVTIFAYLDPGTGSAIVQAVIGGAIAIAAIVRIYWSKITAVFTKDKSKKDKEDLRSNN